MKKLFTLLSLTFLTVLCSYGQSSVTATFSAGVIPANYSSYSSTCNLDDTMNIAVPAGALIVGMDVSYSMVAASGAWMSEQRSRMECLNNSNTETQFYPGSSNSGGTYNYSRSDVNIANGISSGSITLRMQVYRTWGGSGCETSYQHIPNNSWTVTVYYCPGTPTYTPIIAEDSVLAVCGDSFVNVSANSNYSSFMWSNGDSNATATFSQSGEYIVLATDSGGCPYPDTVMVSLITPSNMFPTDTTICQGESVELNAYYDPNPCVLMNEFLETNSNITDHNSLTGDDNGGIAITPDYFYYTGDNNTVRYNASNLTGGISLPQREGIFSDLASGQVYTFWDTVANDFNANYPAYSYNSINAVRTMDDSLNYGTVIGLSETINAGSSSFIGAGSGFVILWANTNNTFYHIELSNGQVTNLGTGDLQTTGSSGIYMNSTENWADWGIAECLNGGYSVVGRCTYLYGSYQYSPGRMVRWDIANASAEQIGEFSGSVSDMACVTYSPWHQRWYFHYEGGGLFGGSSETAGYADATTGTASPFTINWSNGDSGQVITVTPDSTTMYIVEITDGTQSCYDTATVTVTVSPDISFSVTNVACKGDSNGAVSTTLNGGTSPFDYNWMPMNTSVNLGTPTASSISNVPAGYYILSVVDDNGCSDLDTAYVWEPLSVFSPILNGEMDPLCSYSEDGRSIVLTAGGDAPYTFNWSNGVTNDTNTTLADGAYTVTVSDANGCERVLSGDVEAPSAVEMTLTSTGNVCEDDNDGSASVTATGGTSPYAYAWDNGDDDPNANSLTSGFHWVTITDANGCDFVDSVEVTFQNAAPNIPLPDSVEKCANNTVTLDAGTEGASYMWSTGDTSQVITTNAGGLLFVTVTGPNGCEATKSIFVVNNPCPTGIDAIGDVPFINVYPNPSNGVINIEVKGSLDASIDLELTDLTGRVMDNRNDALSAGSSFTTLDLSALARGTYMLRMLRNGELITVRQIVIQ
ncbi:MAG: T9SS type A sorting domain-containing protein [Cryomorphaceae bacterium]